MNYLRIIAAVMFLPLSVNLLAEGKRYMADNKRSERKDTLAVELKEVTVSAVKGSSSVMLQPEAASVISGKELERLDAVSIRGISDVVPNFFMPDYGSRITSTIYVRGIGARMDQPSIGLNVDNIPYLNKDAYDFDVEDISHVEMLRGPQSTLYGRNTMAGVINVTTLSPFRFNGWRIMAQSSSRSRLKGSVGWYGTLGERTALSLTGSFSGLPGEFVNEYSGKKLDHERNFALRGKLLWRAGNGLFLQNVASAGFLRQGGYPYEYKETGKIAFNDTCFYRRFTFADGLTLRRSYEAFNLTSISSVQYIDDNMTLDQDFLPEDYFTLTQKKKEWAVTQDVVVRNNASGSDYNWLGGVFGFYKHLDMLAPVTFKNKGIAELIEKHRNDANPYYPIEWDTRQFPLNSDFKLPTWGLAAYHESNLRVGRWNFTAGLRLDFEKAVLSYISDCHTGYTIYKETDGEREFNRKVAIDINDSGTFRRHFFTLLPKFAALYMTDYAGSNVYFKFSRGYKAGGFNTQMFSDVLQQRLMRFMGVGAQYNIDEVVGYKPEQSWNYEVGGHFNIGGGLLELETALFYIDCRDQQLTMFPDGTTTGRIMTNAGRTRSVGGEASLTIRPSKPLMLTASYGFTDARFRKFFNGITDFRGRTLPYAPKNTVFLQGVWSVESGKAKLDFDVNMRGTGKIYWNEDNSEWQNFYCLLGASASVSVEKISFQLWGRNLTSTSYRTFYFLSMGNAFYQRGRGRELGITMRINI